MSTYPAEDGVVLRHEVVGNTGTAGSGVFSANDLGRTATHEVGHWLNLRHIWGDDYCGNDFVDDTPEAEEANYGCFNFPHNDFNGCGSDSAGEMFMNYMDYVDDGCMNIFTYGQAERMWAAIDGPRSGLKTSKGCEAVQPLGISNNVEIKTRIFPNPATDHINVSFNKSLDLAKISITDLTGRQIYSGAEIEINGQNTTLSIEQYPRGVYLLSVESKGITTTQKFIVQ